MVSTVINMALITLGRVIKQNADRSEYWLARKLSDTLNYTEWRNFLKVVDKAKLACKDSGFDIDDHFVKVNKTIEMPKSASKKILTTNFPSMLVISSFKMAIRAKRLSHMVKLTLLYRHIGRKSLIISINWMRTTSALLYAEMLSNGIRCLPKTPVARG
ncbi:MAG: hypothetical protein LBD23_10415 [Oscillospiraceae bacterium]|nr:hypothetical protein [Oscillospiraceae bacterium]